MAERQGFEPWVPYGTTVFETAPFDHSGTSPQPETDMVIAKKLAHPFRKDGGP